MIENYPWTYHYDDCDEYGNGEIHDSCGGFIAITIGPNYGAFHKDGHSHFEGIARLIAASPELLIELRQAVIQMEMAAECIQNGRYDEALLHASSLMSSKRAAIAKATGE